MTNTPDDKAPRAKLAAITDALARRDNAALLALLDDNGADASWCDDRGQTLLHFAALHGDEELCEALISKKGFSPHARNEDGDTPARLAAVFGHVRLAGQLAEIASLQPSPTTLPVVASLADLRRQGAVRGVNMFYHYACHMQFADVVDAALKTGEALTSQDLLAMGQKGETVLLRLAQSGQLDTLLRTQLWQGEDRQAVLRSLRDSLPRDYHAVITASPVLQKPAAPQAEGKASGTPSTPGNHRRFKFGPK